MRNGCTSWETVIFTLSSDKRKERKEGKVGDRVRAEITILEQPRIGIIQRLAGQKAPYV